MPSSASAFLAGLVDKFESLGGEREQARHDGSNHDIGQTARAGFVHTRVSVVIEVHLSRGA